ncbi:hypothetical protein CKAH01_03446 [Colletotrichum kahawae]|uniref:Uncharacterized protein n=1 Tax=Colletotrichum kahawae TaxID=34407 RepID=A0AAE0DAP5_COLKA|nr:hypothetical protein CKAH01_03446 [Colletotrichum kahawae]
MTQTVAIRQPNQPIQNITSAAETDGYHDPSEIHPTSQAHVHTGAHPLTASPPGLSPAPTMSPSKQQEPAESVTFHKIWGDWAGWAGWVTVGRDSPGRVSSDSRMTTSGPVKLVIASGRNDFFIVMFREV